MRMELARSEKFGDYNDLCGNSICNALITKGIRVQAFRYLYLIR